MLHGTVRPKLANKAFVLEPPEESAFCWALRIEGYGTAHGRQGPRSPALHPGTAARRLGLLPLGDVSSSWRGSRGPGFTFWVPQGFHHCSPVSLESKNRSVGVPFASVFGMRGDLSCLDGCPRVAAMAVAPVSAGRPRPGKARWAGRPWGGAFETQDTALPGLAPRAWGLPGRLGGLSLKTWVGGAPGQQKVLESGKMATHPQAHMV